MCSGLGKAGMGDLVGRGAWGWRRTSELSMLRLGNAGMGEFLKRCAKKVEKNSRVKPPQALAEHGWVAPM